MGNCESILNQIRYWEREATRLRNELKKWKKRKKDVESVKSSLSSVAQNSSSDVNSKITKRTIALTVLLTIQKKEVLWMLFLWDAWKPQRVGMLIYLRQILPCKQKLIYAHKRLHNIRMN